MARITEGLLAELLKEYEADEMSLSEIVAQLNKRARSKVVWAEYTCTECKEVQKFGKDENIVAGYCRNCGHPVWNEEVNNQN